MVYDLIREQMYNNIRYWLEYMVNDFLYSNAYLSDVKQKYYTYVYAIKPPEIKRTIKIDKFIKYIVYEINCSSMYLKTERKPRRWTRWHKRLRSQLQEDLNVVLLGVVCLGNRKRQLQR